MFKHNPKLSRRQVQRRFPPGTFIVFDNGRMSMVVGWAPVAPTYNRWGEERFAKSWKAYIINKDCRLETVEWMWMRDLCTLEEWEKPQ